MKVFGLNKKYDMEIWKDVPGFSGYQISNYGNVKALAKTWRTGFAKRIVRQGVEKIMKCGVNNWGYKWLRLSRDGKKKIFFIHIAVAELFCSNPDGKPQVNHKDGDKLNNNHWNLEWTTQAENTQHAYDIGLAKGAQGEKSGSAKLKNSDVIFIRQEYRDRKITQADLANKFQVRANLISRIVNNKIWKHI